MQRDKSIEFLNKCLSELQNMSQAEFNRIEKEKGIGDLIIDKPPIDEDFIIIFPGE